jgi:arylsulfatase A-like enzyme
VGTPAIFGMNFQTVSTAQKLPRSDGLTGGYLADGITPGPLLSRALDFINAEIGQMLTAVSRQHLDGSTTVILSAKHGQSPQDPAKLTRIPDGPILDALNAAWNAAHPAAPAPLVLGPVNDDGRVIWLTDRSQAAADFAEQFLLNHSGVGNPRPYTASGLRQVFAGAASAAFFHVQPGDPRVPDVFGISQVGVVYTGGKKKIAEHGGANPQGLDVPLVVSGALVENAGGEEDDPVETTQIAPTILRLPGLDPQSLRSVQIEGTRALPLD